MREKPSRGKLVDFHTRNKLLILSHSPNHYQQMGRWVAQGKEFSVKALYARYQTLFLEALKLKATSKKNANVLQHMMGYFKDQLSGDEKQELLDIINRFRQGTLPLIVPMTLVTHYVRKYKQTYLEEQSYLQPHPTELQLRNHV